MVVIGAARLHAGSRPATDGREAVPRRPTAILRAVGGTGRQTVPAPVFEIECEVEYDGSAHRFRFEVTARDEDEATDRAIEMLDRARVTDTRRKTA